MSWRHFSALLSGLGPNTAVVATQSSRKDGGATGSAGQKVIEIDMDANPQQADAFFASMTGRHPKRKRKP